MQELTSTGQQAVQSLAQRYGVSSDAVRTLLQAVSAGGGTMAQFYHPELGGGGQWMQGGMIMVGDMFNHGLKATVGGLCSELSSLLASQQVFAPVPQFSAAGFVAAGNAWWPADLGSPSSSGGQNDSRYAYFPQTRRLAIDRAGQVTVYDTLDHQIGGVQQQQGGSYGSLSFSSQRGTFGVDSLPVVSGAGFQSQSQVSTAPSPGYQQPAPQPFAANAPSSGYQQPASQPFAASASNSGYQQPFAANTPPDSQGQQAILEAIERLADLHQRGILSDDEFRSKKAELLARL